MNVLTELRRRFFPSRFLPSGNGAKALTQMNRWGAKFGLSPSDQTGVAVTPRSDGKKKARFFA